jgi:hypothetical protein
VCAASGCLRSLGGTAHGRRAGEAGDRPAPAKLELTVDQFLLDVGPLPNAIEAEEPRERHAWAARAAQRGSYEVVALTAGRK